MGCPKCGRACRMKSESVRRGCHHLIKRTFSCGRCGWETSSVMGKSYADGVLTPDGSIYWDGVPLDTRRYLRRDAGGRLFVNNTE